MLGLLRLLGPYVIWLYPLGVVILVLYLRAWLVASRNLRASLFSVEREDAARQMQRAARGAFVVFGLLAALFVIQFVVAPSIDLSQVIRPTPTPDLNLHPVYANSPTPGTPAPIETPAPTSTRRPTPRPITLQPLPTPTSKAPVVTVVPPNCSTPGVQIVEPGQGARVRGRVEIKGTAKIPGFQFYKIEMGLGEHPSHWTTISEVHRSPVVNGLLDVWDVSGLPSGSYTLRLVVVDTSGNFPTPCEVMVIVTP